VISNLTVGHLGRGEYFLINLIPPLCTMGFDVLDLFARGELISHVWIFVISLCSIGLFYTSSLYRIRDTNLSPWWMIAVIFPLSSPLIFLFLCWKRSQHPS
jgi:uncharacterized membrane protein YhaH (DUF805 family)